MAPDLDRLLADAAAAPRAPLDVGALDQRRRRRHARRRAVGAVASLAVVVLGGIGVLRAAGPEVGLAPADEPSAAAVGGDPLALLGIWEVREAAGEEPGAILRLDGSEAMLVRACGTMFGPWSARPEGVFVQGPNGFSNRCWDRDPTPAWLRDAAAFGVDGTDRLLLDGDGHALARLVPGDLDPLPEHVWEGYATPPAADWRAERALGPNAPLPGGLVPARAHALVGRWEPAGVVPVELELTGDGRWLGRDECASREGRWRVGHAGALVLTSGPVPGGPACPGRVSTVCSRRRGLASTGRCSSWSTAGRGSWAAGARRGPWRLRRRSAPAPAPSRATFPP